jgi:hypothetical protein
MSLKVLVHKSLMGSGRVIPCVKSVLAGNGVPQGSGLAVNMFDDVLVIEPLDCEDINLFGEETKDYKLLANWDEERKEE